MTERTGRLVITLDAGPAFKGNAGDALFIAARDCIPDSPMYEVFERLRAGVELAEWQEDPPEAAEMSTSDGLGA